LTFALISALSVTPVNANQMIVKKGVVFMTSDNILTIAPDSSDGLSCAFANGFFEAGATPGRISVAVQGAKFIEFKNDHLYVATLKQGVVGFEKFDVSACLSNTDDNEDDSSKVHAELNPAIEKGPCARVSTMPSALEGSCRPGEL
jgi:hypothetical protein